MNRLIAVIIMFFVLASQASAQEGEMPLEAIEDECLNQVMTAFNVDFANLSASDLISMCEDMPLGEDLSVQLLAVLVGPPIYHILEVVTAVTGKAHGFSEDSHLLHIGANLHDVAKAFNYVMLGIFVFFLTVNIGSLLLKWQKTGSKSSITDWVANKSPATVVTGLLLTPVLGWISPIQFIALTFIVGLSVFTKIAVVYLFLGAFFSDASSEVQKELSASLREGIGKTVLLHQCDLEQREDMLFNIQRAVGSSLPEALKEEPLYNCLVSSVPVADDITRISSSRDSNIYHFTPGNLSQTQQCMRDNRATLEDWGVDIPESCGHITLTLPNNTATNSWLNATELYLSNDILHSQRELALKVHEYNCRQPDSIVIPGGGPVPGCMQASINGSGYEYTFSTDPLTGAERLSPYQYPLSQASTRDLRREMVVRIREIESGIRGNTSAMLQHIKDLTAPMVGGSDLSPNAQKASDDFRDGVIGDYEGGGDIGFSESDARFLVSNIKRGAWASGSLFFGKFADGIRRDMLIDKITNTYGTTLNRMHFFGENLAAIELNKALTGEGMADTAKGVFSSALMPRVGLYVDSLGCWHDSIHCTPAPLNPFTYLGQTGASLVDGGLTRFAIASGIGSLAEAVMGDKAGKFMLTDTLKEFYLLYTVLGIVLAILIPGIPLIKLLVMLINWLYDVVRELLALSITLALSPMGGGGNKLFTNDVRESFVRLLGLGLYFMFVVLGVCAMFLMFSFLFGLNVFFVGILSYVVQWTGASNSIEAMVMNTIFDVIITGVLVYEVKLCTKYIEKFPQELSEYFKINVSNSSSVMDAFESKVRSAVLPRVGDFLAKLK